MRTQCIAILICLGITAGVGSLAYSFNSFNASSEEFTQAGWQKLQPQIGSSSDPGCVLGGLANGLKGSGLLNHKTERFVIEQIGPPVKRSGNELIYPLGQCHGWGWHHSELAVQLSVNRTVRNITIRSSE